MKTQFLVHFDVQQLAGLRTVAAERARVNGDSVSVSAVVRDAVRRLLAEELPKVKPAPDKDVLFEN